jgi:hypothetical protein
VETTTQRGTSSSILLAKYYSGVQIKDQMGRARDTYEKQKRCLEGFGGGGGHLRERNHLEDLDKMGR